MGLETDITDIQSLNQNWPPVSDPRAQGADHIRNIKKAIQLTFPNLKQCLLNDAQFTALGTLIGDGSGTFTINGKLTVSDTLTVKETLLVPTVTDWTTQQAVGAKDAEGRYLKPGDADGRYLKPGDADGRYVQQGVTGGNDKPVKYAWLDLTTEAGYPRLGVGDTAGTSYGFYSIAKVNALIGACLGNTNPGISGALAGTSLCVNPADGLPYLAYSGNSKIVTLALDSAKVNKADGTMSALNVENGGYFRMAAGSQGYATWFRNTSTATDGVLDLYSNVGGSNTNVMRLVSDGSIMVLGGGNITVRGEPVAFQSQLPFIDQNLRVQVWAIDSCSDSDTITIPTAFSSTLGVTAQDMTPNSRYGSINPLKIDTDLMSGSQFKVRIFSEGTNRRVLFVAYGYL